MVSGNSSQRLTLESANLRVGFPLHLMDHSKRSMTYKVLVMLRGFVMMLYSPIFSRTSYLAASLVVTAMVCARKSAASSKKLE